MLPFWFVFAALLSTIATLRKTTCKEKNILQSWRAEFTDTMLRWRDSPLKNANNKNYTKKKNTDGEPVLNVHQTHCSCCWGTSPCFCRRRLSFLRKQPSEGGGRRSCPLQHKPPGPKASSKESSCRTVCSHFVMARSLKSTNTSSKQATWKVKKFIHIFVQAANGSF